MSRTITLTDEQYQALQNGQSITIEPPEPSKWKPKGGEWFVASDGSVARGISSSEHRDFGAERKTKNLLQKARDAMRIHNRLLAYVQEHAPDYEPGWSNNSEQKWYIEFYHSDEWYEVDFATTYQVPGAVYMPKDVAVQLARNLNNGTVVL